MLEYAAALERGADVSATGERNGRGTRQRRRCAVDAGVGRMSAERQTAACDLLQSGRQSLVWSVQNVQFPYVGRGVPWVQGRTGDLE